MKKFLLVLAIGSFAACSGSSDNKSTDTAAAKPADTTAVKADTTKKDTSVVVKADTTKKDTATKK